MMKARLLLIASLLFLSSNAHAELYRWYKLDADTGDTAPDLSPLGVDGQIFDGTWVDDNVRGTVLEFDGNTSWVDAGFLPLMDLENTFTWSFWENQADSQASPANEIIVGSRWGAGGTTDTSPREFIKFTPNRFEYHLNGAAANDLNYGPDPDDPEHIPSDGDWRHHTVVKAGETLAYYRNGELFNERDLIDAQFSADPFPIALGGQHGAETWAGRMSDFRLYDHALTADEVGIVMSGGTLDGGGEEIGYTESYTDQGHTAEWCTNGDNINFRMSAPGEGWVALGFSDDQLMPNTDLVMATGEGDIQDSFADGRFAPAADGSQDAQGVSASQEGGMTVVEFSRAVTTGDDRDFALDSERFLLWGSNSATDNFNSRHSARGFSPTKIDFHAAAACTTGGDPLDRLDDGSLTDLVERANYIHDVLGTWVGDSTNDGEFNSSDLVAVFQAGVYEDAIVGNAVWATGDWNGDGDFDTADLVYAFQDGGFEIGPRNAVNAVPEPSSVALVALGLIGFAVRRRR